MSEEVDAILRRSLDAVDRHRRRLTWLLWIAVLTAMWEFYHLGQIAGTGDVPHLIVQAVLALFFSSLFMVVVLVFQLNVATRRILRAIDLASRSTPSSRQG
jgi:hypothetical protein